MSSSRRRRIARRAEEIGRYWRIAHAHWADFRSGRDAKADPKAVSERFVTALLRDAFGFTSLVAAEPTVPSGAYVPDRARNAREEARMLPRSRQAPRRSPQCGDNRVR